MAAPTLRCSLLGYNAATVLPLSIGKGHAARSCFNLRGSFFGSCYAGDLNSRERERSLDPSRHVIGLKLLRFLRGPTQSDGEGPMRSRCRSDSGDGNDDDVGTLDDDTLEDDAQARQEPCKGIRLQQRD